MLHPGGSGCLGGLGSHRQQPQQPAAPQRECVRILVLGDERVGKSSLVSAFVSQCFPEKVRGVHCVGEMTRPLCEEWVTKSITLHDPTHSTHRSPRC